MKRCPFFDSKTKQSVVCKGLYEGQTFATRFDSIAGRKAYTAEYCWNGVACMDCGVFRVLRGDYVDSDAGAPPRGWRL